VNLGYTVLRAPFAGVVTVRQAELGEVVSPGSPVITLSDLDHIWLRAYVAETDLGAFTGARKQPSPPTPIRQAIPRAHFIHLTGCRVYAQERADLQGAVTLVYRIKIDIDNPNHELKPGMPADTRIDLASGKQNANPSAAAPARQ